MAEPQKLVLMVQPARLQGLIWQSVLKSQQISVIWESPETNLVDNINLLKEAELTLPDLLLVDVKAPNFNPYEFCRWCRENHPSVKVVLTDVSLKEISRYERRWAIYQGAADLLPGFQRENLVSSVASSVKRVLEVMDSYPLNNGALISVLLSMKRQLESRMGDRPPLAANASVLRAATTTPQPVAKKAMEKEIAPVASSHLSPMQEIEEVVIPATVTPQASLQKPEIREEDPPPVRRYRGVTY
jgi:CheY-like chemotaxis protein